MTQGRQAIDFVTPALRHLACESVIGGFVMKKLRVLLQTTTNLD